MTPTSLQPKLTYEEALEAVYAERVSRRGGLVNIPTSIFVGKIDVNMPALPPMAFFRFNERGDREQIRGKDQPYSPLALSLHDSVWIDSGDFAAIRKFAEGMILKGASGSVPTERRMEILRRSAIKVVEDLFENPNPENITKSTKVVSSFVYVLMKDPSAYLLLSKLSSHDPYTLQHSVGTAVNSIILARKAGINDEDQLQEVGLAGLLHDVGKTKVKKEIINKEGPLDELEWEEMRGHSLAGYEIVKDHPAISERTKRAILEHHEDKIGTGYPHGKKSEQVDLFSKIVCLADVFNALTTNRSYSKARSPFEAFQLMREKLLHKIDDELFRQMVLVYGGKLDGLASIEPQKIGA
jgi:HD-GYP domain-containing protein (c-di-GMP phosphodiesterase class II)